MSEILEKLRAPFDTTVIKTYKVAGKDIPFAGARAYMDRLDEVVGPSGWSTSYEVLDQTNCAVECKLTLYFDGQAVTKSDVGYPNSARDADDAEKEPLKAAYSDAFKRAAVQWGVGRFLYDYAPGKPEPQPKPVAVAKTKKEVAQWGSFLAPNGEFNNAAWSNATKGKANRIREITNSDLKKWLADNPDKTLDNLIELASTEAA